MSNAIKYTAGNLTGSLQKGNVALGLDVLGPTSTTGWYLGFTPTPGRYVVYETDINNPPRIYFPANDAELIRVARQEGATGANTGSVQAVLAWATTNSNIMIVNESYPKVVTDGLNLLLDASFTPSYPTSASIWYDVSGKANNGDLTNGPTFSNGAIVFDGTNDYVQVKSPFGNVDWASRAWSFSAFMKLDALGDRCLVNLNSPNTSDYIVTNVFYTDQKSYWYFIKNSTAVQTNFTQTTGNFPTNQIFHFTMTYNGNGLSSSNINFYKNGVLLTTTEGGSAGLSNQAGLQIGGTNYPLDGNVYNFLMYNKVLSQSEILQNYYQGPIVTNGLIFAINSSNPVSYESGSIPTYSLTGSLSGSLTNGTGFNSGYGGNWVFDGVDDFINLSTFPAISYANGITIEIVIRFAGLGGGGWERFLDSRDTGGSGTFISFGRNSVFNNIFFQCANISGGDTQRRYVTTGNPLVAGEIAFYTVTMGAGTPGNENSNIVLYKNGIPLSASFSDGIPRLPSTTVRNQNYVARSPFAGNSFLSGSIYQFKMYNRGLSASEVAQNFGAQRSIYGI